MSDDHFLDLLGATNLIPGPNSTEMAIHIGHRRAGWPGLLVDVPSALLAVIGATLLLTGKVGSMGLVLAGAATGLLLSSTGLR
jgi:chromate transporter